MSEDIIETNAANWKEEVLESKELVVVEFWHPQCPYCKMVEPVYAELSKEYAGKLKFAKLNVLKNQENQELAAKYGVMSTPTLKFFCQGRSVLDIVVRCQRIICDKGLISQLANIESVQKGAPLGDCRI